MAKRILIADDHESVLRRIRALLESEPDWEVCGEAVNGHEAIAKAKELEPDLVILDFAMPRLNGLKAAAEINRFLPDVPIVMFTMYGSALRQEAQKHGIRRRGVAKRSQSAKLSRGHGCHDFDDVVYIAGFRLRVAPTRNPPAGSERVWGSARLIRA